MGKYQGHRGGQRSRSGVSPPDSPPQRPCQPHAADLRPCALVRLSWVPRSSCVPPAPCCPCCSFALLPLARDPPLFLLCWLAWIPGLAALSLPLHPSPFRSTRMAGGGEVHRGFELHPGSAAVLPPPEPAILRVPGLACAFTRHPEPATMLFLISSRSGALQPLPVGARPAPEVLALLPAGAELITVRSRDPREIHPPTPPLVDGQVADLPDDLPGFLSVVSCYGRFTVELRTTPLRGRLRLMTRGSRMRYLGKLGEVLMHDLQRRARRSFRCPRCRKKRRGQRRQDQPTMLGFAFVCRWCARGVAQDRRAPLDPSTTNTTPPCPTACL